MALDGYTRVLEPHDAKIDYHMWVTLGDKFVHADALGRGPRGFHRWQVWQCNNTECPARALVSVSKLEEVVEDWLPECPPNRLDVEVA